MSAASQSDIKGTMTSAEFETTSEFLACSEKQRRWLQTLISNGFDYAMATEAAFECRSPRNARLFGYAVRRQAHIVAALNVYLGKSERDAEIEEEAERKKAFLKRVDKLAADPKATVAQIDALRYQARVHGWVGAERLPNTHGHDKAEDPEPAQAQHPAASEVSSSSRVPPGATALVDNQGVVRGYRTAVGEYVQLADVEVAQ